MSRQVKIRRGTAAQHETFIGAEGEITMDTTNNTLRVHDGVTPGGTPMAKQSDMPIPEPVITAIQKQQDGYVKFANGLIIQWGRATGITTTAKTITLPIPFTGTYAISGNDSNIGCGNLQLTHFDATRAVSGTSSFFRWMAIGY